MHHNRFLPTASLILASIFAASVSAPARAEVSITDIGSINGRASFGVGINHALDVAGSAFFSGTIGVPNGPPSEPFLTHAILFNGGALHDLGAIEGNPTCSPLGCQSEAFGINDQEWVVGWTDNGSSGTLAYLWLPAAVPGAAAGFNALPALSPVAGSAAVAVNNSGQMVGFSKLPNYTPRAALWQLRSTGATLTDLGTLRADQAGSGIADGVNDLGQVVGSASDETYAPQGFLYLPSPAYGLPAGLHNLTGPAGQFSGEATCLNNLGEVAGVLDGTQPFVWLPSASHGLAAGLTVLPLERSLLGFIPAGISDGGVIVGLAFVETNPGTGEYTRTAAAWRNGSWIYLNDLLPIRGDWDLFAAQAVTHSGKTTSITGVAYNPNIVDVNGVTGVLHGYVLSVTCPGDLNDDGAVDQKDLTILRSQLGQSVPPGTGGDLNGDGVVDSKDRLLLTSEFGDACLSGTLVTSAAPTADAPAVQLSLDSQSTGGAASQGAAFQTSFDPALYLRPYDLAGANALGGRNASESRSAVTVAGESPLAPARGLSAWPLPYRGGSMIVSLSASAGVGSNADVAIFDLTGRKIRTLTPSAGGVSRSLTWDGRDANGLAVGNGVYFLRATGAGHSAQLKVAVVR